MKPSLPINLPSDSPRSRPKRPPKRPSSPQVAVSRSPVLRKLALSAGLLIFGVMLLRDLHDGGRSSVDADWDGTPVPLEMEGGDPYLRALMRTISASESSHAQPYSLLYGGEHFEEFDRHPDYCVSILAGPNVGQCTTAAGRYQFLTHTWEEKADQYHPDPPMLPFLGQYSFEPEYQDAVVYAWLDDSQAWGADLSTLLQDGELSEVLWMLSGTWTSLGYGIEDNVMTSTLPDIYSEMLEEELSAAP